MSRLELNKTTNVVTTSNNNTNNSNDNHLTPPPSNPKYSGLQKKTIVGNRLNNHKTRVYFDSADWAASLSNGLDDYPFEKPLINAGLVSTNIPPNKAH